MPWNDPSSWFTSTPPDPNAPPDPGALTSAFANPWVSIPYAVGSGLLAASAPRRGTGALALGLNTGIGVGMNAEKSAYDRARQQRLSDALGKLTTATAPVTTDTKLPSAVYAPDTGEGSTPMSEMRLSDTLAAIPTYKKTEEKPVFTPKQQEYLKMVGQVEPAAALRAVGSTLFKEPQKPTSLRPGGVLVDETGTPLYTAPAAPTRPVAVAPGRQLVEPDTGRVVYTAPTAPDNKEPPALTEPMAIAIEGKVNRNVPLNKREMDALGTDDPKMAKEIVQEMRKIKQSGQVDIRTAIAQAVAGVHAATEAGKMTGKEARTYKIDETTGEITDAVSEGLSTQSALKKGYRELTPQQDQVLKMGDAAVASLHDYRDLAQRVLNKEPGLVNMTMQKLNIWLENKASTDADAALFLQQSRRTLPLLLQSFGLSGSRIGLKMLEFEAPALPNSGQTMGVALKTIERDEKTVRDIQKSLVSGKYGDATEKSATPGAKPSPSSTNSAEDRLKQKFNLK